MYRHLASHLLASALLVTAACGGDDGNDVTPTLIPGGGVSDPGIDGEVNVYVIDEDTDAPISGATVRVGAIEGTTDATGLFVAAGADLVGPQTILVKATGRGSGMWVGVGGANITIGLGLNPEPMVDPPQAELSGTIAGWDNQTVAEGHIRVALVTYSQGKNLDDAGNDIEQPAGTNILLAGACVRLPDGTPGQRPCAWRVAASTGTIALGAVVVDVDTNGTPLDDSDDTQAVIGAAVLNPITVVAGTNQAGLSLDLLAPAQLTTAAVAFGTLPAGWTLAQGVVGLDLGAGGVLRTQLVTPAASTVVVPSLSVATGSSYELLVVARESDAADAAESVVIRRGLASASGLDAGAFLTPPTGLASDRATISLARSAGADLDIIEISTSSGSGTSNQLFGIAILDGTTSVTLPTDFAPLPSGALEVKATSADLADGVELDDFAIDDFETLLLRAASDSIRLN